MSGITRRLIVCILLFSSSSSVNMFKNRIDKYLERGGSTYIRTCGHSIS